MPGCPVSPDFDPFGAAYTADPAAAQAQEGPVYFSERLGWYVVTRHEDLKRIYADTESFSSANFAEPITPLCEAAQAKLAEHGFEPIRSLGGLDEPIHTPLREKIREPFKPAAAAAWEPRIRKVHTAYIDAFAGRGRADLVGEFLWEAPAVVAIEFMGVPSEDVAEVKEYAVGLLDFISGRPSEAEQIAVCDAIGKHENYARGLIARLREDPSGPGVLQHAVRAYQDDPEGIDEHFLVSLGVNTLAAAHETTSGSLANGLLYLLSHREKWEALCDDPELIPGAVEECLRIVPTLTTGRRLCVKDTVVDGVEIPAGAQVLLGVSAANLDADVFAEPDQLDFERRNAKRHFTFGYGPHFCLGAPLARVQMRVALEELTSRLPQMRLVADQSFEYVPSASSRAPAALVVEWSAT